MSRFLIYVLLVFAFVSLVEAAQIDPALSVYLNFDEVNDLVVEDMTANGNDGILTKDAALEDGKFGSALKFEAGVRIDFDGANFVNPPAEAVTMGAWMLLDDTGSDHEVFDCVGTGHDSGQYHFEIKPGGAVRWFHRDETNTTIFNIQTGVVPAEEWAHVIGTYDSDSGEAALYINGEEIFKVAGNGDLSTDWAVGAGIGQHKGGRQLRGLMDEFYMFNRALDHDEVIALMNGEFGPTLAVDAAGKLAACWGGIKSDF